MKTSHVVKLVRANAALMVWRDMSALTVCRTDERERRYVWIVVSIRAVTGCDRLCNTSTDGPTWKFLTRNDVEVRDAVYREG